jgi:hypothetical protein
MESQSMKPFAYLLFFGTVLFITSTHAEEKFLAQIGIRNACAYDMEVLLVLNVLEKERRFGWRIYKAGDQKHHYVLEDGGITVAYDANTPAYVFFRVKDHPEFFLKGGDFPITFDGKHMMTRIPEAATNRQERATGIALTCPDAEAALVKK